ncbi:two-component regulator propeller domain-containing protein [Arcticibacter sp.]|uniref:hybrid sensor histidine kinase/response regulator transcription factor n=1 Tax=Arcticibacter sp. TaxID=1872630 RepID=UPI00388F9A0A
MITFPNRASALFLLCYLAFAGGLNAQKIHFRNYTVADGLCSNTIWDIEQDEQGYMWFGTKYGLNRFDGYEFKSYQHHKDDPSSIGNNFIRKIFKYDRKTFWIGTDGGVYLFNLESQKFKLFEPLGKIFINDITRVKNGDIWIATKEKGAYRYQYKTGRLQHYGSFEDSAFRLSSNEVSKIVEDDDGNIWLGTYGKGIDVLRSGSSRIDRYRADGKKGSLSHDAVIDLYKDLEGRIWVGTMSGGLNLFNSSSNSFTVFKRTAGNSISDNLVRGIFQPKPGVLYIATEKGLNVLDISTKKFTAYQHRSNDPYSISDDAVYTVFKDNKNGIWSGTFFGGVNYHNEDLPAFEYYYSSGGQNSLSGNAVSAFLESGKDNFWIGTEDGGLSYFDSASKTFHKYPFRANQDTLSYHNIHALYEDRNNNVWIGMYTGGLNIYNPRTGKIRRYTNDPADPSSLSDNSVYSIDEDGKGRIWVSTISGLNVYDPEKDKFLRIRGGNLDKMCIYQVCQDSEQNLLWIATYDNGLLSLDPDTKIIQRYSYSEKPGSISSNKVITLFDDRKGNLWVGTDGGGLNLFDKKTKTFKVYGDDYGIKSAVIFGIVEDDKGKLWLSTNSGIYEFDPKTKKERNFGRWDNLQSQQYNYKSYYKSSSGKLYFGGIKGFNAFYPDSIRRSNDAAVITFTNFQLFNKDVDVQEDNSPLEQAINFTKHITLRYDQSVISFEYAALYYQAPEKARYAYKMEGFDKDWNLVGQQRKATYTNLPPGDYVFKVAEMEGGAISERSVSSIQVTIKPPFYKTTLAYIIYAVLLIAAILTVRRYSILRSRKNNERKLERLKAKSEQDFYKQKIEFFTAMAHEIRTPLSLIIAPLERLMSAREKDPDTAGQLKIMEENSDRLLNLVNQLLDFRRIESDIYEIHVEKMELVSFVGALHKRFSSIPYKNTVSFVLKSDLRKLELYADPEALTKILSNLLINAFKFTRSRVEIRVHEVDNSGEGDAFVAISVEDDGIGIPQNQLNNIFTKFFKVSSDNHHYSNLGGAGIGLALAKSLTEKHGGELLVESDSGIRTIFTVRIPLVLKQKDVADLFADADAEETPPNDQPSVLVVEDDKALRSFIYESLLNEGYQAIKAKNGVEGLEQLRKHTPDIVISDVMMPEMDGFELCRTIKTDINYSHIPVILLTAKTNAEAEIEGLENGADAYISKPFKWKQVSLITKNLLDLQLSLRQKFAQQPFEGAETFISESRDKKFMSNLISSIETHLSDTQFSVEELGKELGLSRSSLYKKVKSLTGYVPNEFIRLIRLKHAAKLLSMQEYTISEVGYMAGFNSHSYFSKCFYQQFKETPSEFAEKNKKRIEAS